MNMDIAKLAFILKFYEYHSHIERDISFVRIAGGPTTLGCREGDECSVEQALEGEDPAT
ncbi:hypothetical protein LR48_Vigan08g104100 [Vigna angularis]|uniref:Uncharacterized protein n=1 Tax=Phaseolus angularis TaxID=3914 RepID=A0A0L9V696_PHAAN|nr:hypothetical protein LR48_Vigan08g104100 [Vigna angularis]